MIAILIIPALLLIIIIFGFPIVRYLWMSFHAVSVVTGLELLPNNGANWLRLVNDQRFWQDAIHTSRFAITSVSIELILALGIALLLDQRWRYRGAIRTISLLPWALPTTVMALGWRWIFNTPYGPVEQINSFVSKQDLNILSNPDLAWVSTVFADVWKTTPFVALILLAGLQTIPDDLYEAFRLEGGTATKALLKITIPLIQPYILLGALFRLAQAFGVFDLVQIMTGGGPAGTTESIALYAYINAMRFLDFGYSATIMLGGFILLMFSCIFIWQLIRIIRSSRLFNNI